MHEYMNFSREMKTIRIKWKYLNLLKNTILEIKNSIERLISRLDRANEKKI